MPVLLVLASLPSLAGAGAASPGLVSELESDLGSAGFWCCSAGGLDAPSSTERGAELFSRSSFEAGEGCLAAGWPAFLPFLCRALRSYREFIVRTELGSG